MAYNIQKRESTYYFRRRVPQDLIEQLGRTEIIRSLRTKDRAEAVRIARKVSAELDDEWQAMRAALSAAQPAKPDPIARPIDPRYYDEAGSIEIAEEVAKLDAEEEAQDAADAAEADRLMRVLAIVDRRRAEAGHAPLSLEVRAAIAPQKAANQAAETTTSGVNLESLVAIWQRERKPTTKTVQNAMRTVAEIGDPDVSTITRQTIIAYRDKLLDEGKAVNTINTRLSFIRILLGIAKDRSLVEVNHADDTALQEDKRAVDKRKPYSPEQV